MLRLLLGHESSRVSSYVIARLLLIKFLTDLEVSAVIVTLDENPSNSIPASMDELKEFVRVDSFSFVEVWVVPIVTVLLRGPLT